VDQVTSSSLTHTNNFTEVDPLRLGATIGLNNIGMATVDWEKETLELELLRADDSGWTDYWGHPPAGTTLTKVSINFGSRRGAGLPHLDVVVEPWQQELQLEDDAAPRKGHHKWTDPIIDL